MVEGVALYWMPEHEVRLERFSGHGHRPRRCVVVVDGGYIESIEVSQETAGVVRVWTVLVPGVPLFQELADSAHVAILFEHDARDVEAVLFRFLHCDPVDAISLHSCVFYRVPLEPALTRHRARHQTGRRRNTRSLLRAGLFLYRGPAFTSVFFLHGRDLEGIARLGLESPLVHGDHAKHRALRSVPGEV